MSPNNAHPLLEGFAEFRDYSYSDGRRLMPRLVEDGQNPDYYMITCGDSRSNPSTIFNTDPGQIFAFKPIGTIVRPYKQGTALSASLQFALSYLQIPELIVMGHTECGAVKALAENLDDPEIASFIAVAKEGLNAARSKVGDNASKEELLRAAEQQIVLQSVENLKGYPSVAKALAENRLTIRSWIFEMKSGNILEYKPERDAFEAITHYAAPSEPHGHCGCAP